MVCCASTSPKVLTSIGTALTTLLLSRPHSTADRGRLSGGELHPKPSTNCYSYTSEDVLRRPLETGQYLSIRYTERLAEAGIEPSVGRVGDSYDNALAESIIGLYKTEVIRQRGPWGHLEAVEFATLEWVDWFNHRGLLEGIRYVPPAELEEAYYQQYRKSAMVA